MSTATAPASIIPDPYALATAGMVGYIGDVHPLSHGGAWIDPRTWTEDGYASAVRVTACDDGPDSGRMLWIERIVLNKPRDMSSARACCGLPADCTDPLAEAECVMQYMGGEPDQSDYREPSTYTVVIPDDMETVADFRGYARIHGAEIMTEDAVWELLNRLVGRELYRGPAV